MGRRRIRGMQFGNADADCVYRNQHTGKCDKGYIFCAPDCPEKKTEAELKAESEHACKHKRIP